MSEPGLVPLEEIVPKTMFRAEVAAWARRIGVEYREVHLRSMTRKWASCSTSGRLTFDVALLSESAERRAEVIVHELVHLRVPNHGKLFRMLVTAYLRAGTGGGRGSIPEKRGASGR